MGPRPVFSDVFLAGVFVVWAMAEVATGTVQGALGVNLAVAVISPAALAWRRTATVPSALICAGGLAFKTAWGLRLDGLALLAAALVAAYSVGRHLTPRQAIPTIGTVLVLAWLSLFGLPVKDQTVANYPFIALWIGGPALAGAALRSQVERAATAADRAARAEMAQERYAAAAVLDERGRLARELHDTVAHAVSVMVLHTGAVRSRLPADLGSEREALARAEEQGRRAILELRRMLGVLRSDDSGCATGDTAPGPLPALAGVPDLVEETRRTGLRVDLVVEGDVVPLPSTIEASGYRIVQEALTNVRKHARASAVSVRLDYGGDRLRVQVADDGVGAGTIHGDGHGLVGVRERVELYGGCLALDSPPTGGFMLTADLPASEP